MTDKLTSEKRSENMRAIRARDTRPELQIRSSLHALGYRFKLCRRDLPGAPDIVFAARKKVIFVHGCFWHQHPDCREATMPKSRTDFWGSKLSRNVQRDKEQQEALIALGWHVFVAWECELASPSLIRSIVRFLGPTSFEA
ncbi:MAG TPA: very short patch repair endonuclease [Terracidiphilus sp.]|jgi:DNA mismatch endonuclease (patch repair protein)|nr:very short patch repair endonuclease [Terracidiphilus sp.]